MGTQRISAGNAPCRGCGKATAQAPVQRMPAARAFAADETEEAQVHPGVLRPSSGGAPLPSAVRGKMEAAFGHDFRNVRVHHGGGEAQSIGAAAFTRGTHLHFAPGRYQPHTPAGQRLLGHELAHVVQQRAGRVANPGGAVPVNADPALEREAAAAGADVARGRHAAGESVGNSQPENAGPIQPLWVALKNGKVDWSVGRDAPTSNHVWMNDREFVAWKNAGKRHGSNKWTDTVSGRNYYSSNGGVTFFHDKAEKQPLTATEAAQLDRTKMLDRTRTDRARQKKDIALYDVAPYGEAKLREKTGDQMEHDHVPSGESRKIASAMNGGPGPKQAYDRALAIEIRGRGPKDDKEQKNWDHKRFSPTWGARQQNIDHLDTGAGITSMKRPAMDAKYPEAAFHRDVDTMLTHTNRVADGLVPTGAYRYLARQNLKIGVLSSLARGIRIRRGDPLRFKKDQGGVTYEADPSGKSQMELIDAMLMGHTTNRLSTPGGNPTPLASPHGVSSILQNPKLFMTALSSILNSRTMNSIQGTQSFANTGNAQPFQWNLPTVATSTSHSATQVQQPTPLFKPMQAPVTRQTTAHADANGSKRKASGGNIGLFEILGKKFFPN